MKTSPHIAITMIQLFVRGDPRGVTNVPKKKTARDAWQLAVQEATEGESRMTSLCRVRLDFVLRGSSYDRNNPQTPYGSDVDNLASAVLDALKVHVLPMPAGDNAVAELTVTKRKAGEGEPTGAMITVTESTY